jgi:hypothetical protein
MNNFKVQTVAVAIFLQFLCVNHVNSQTSLIMGKQFGSKADEYCLNHVADQQGNIYIPGKTTGNMDGQNAGMNDGFITKMDSLGNIIWTRQFGTEADEDILWSAIDNKGCVYITGSTQGAMNGQHFGKEDIFVVKYNPDGNMEWARQFGTDSTDIGQGIYADKKGFVYITGMTMGRLGQACQGKGDAFLMKLSEAGEEIFTVQFGTSADDYGISVTGDGNATLYVCGSTWGDLGGRNKGFIDAYVGTFTDAGKPVKFMQFGTDGFDMALQLTVDDEKNIYVGGSTSGNLGGVQLGEGDAFLLKINAAGDIEWRRQFGTANHDGVRGICFNKNISDNILISGLCNLAPAYAFIRMYKKDGSLLWERSFTGRGTHGDTSGKDISMDDHGNIYHLGLTGANLFGSLVGGHDVFLVKLKLDRCFMNL